jgi:hypothetical protein
MSIRSRLARLERSFPSDGCPECGFREGAIRMIVVCDAVVPEWPPEDLCSTCGGLKPPVRIVEPAGWKEPFPVDGGGSE